MIAALLRRVIQRGPIDGIGVPSAGDVSWHPAPACARVVDTNGSVVVLATLDGMVTAGPAPSPAFDAVIAFSADVDVIVNRNTSDLERILRDSRDFRMVRRLNDYSFMVTMAASHHPARARLAAVAAMYHYLTRHPRWTTA